ncbi:MAG TPA: two-component regulator propeller domain-containing protein [Fulvivirga sp.]|nr:two-component regulator propeller domain-containing protein [Fulvivirga sp.]
MINWTIFNNVKWIGIIMLVCSFDFGYGQLYLDPNKQPDQYNYDQWTKDVGLSDNAVLSLLQSHDGYIWFASYGGITRFNGIDFHTYSSYNTHEIINNSFTYIFEDDQGTIWGASSGNGAVSILNGVVKDYTNADGLPSNFVESFTQDPSGKLWVATSGGLAYFKGDKFINEGIPNALKTMNVLSIESDSNGHMWAATDSDGVYEFFNDKIIKHYTEANGLVGNRINYVKRQNNKIYVGTTTGLSIISNGNIDNITTGNGLRESNVVSNYLSKNGWLWIGSYRGFCRYKDGEMDYFSNMHAIHNRDITSILEDTEGNLWVATYRAGLFKFWEGKFTNYSDYTLNQSQPFTAHTVLQNSNKEIIFVYEEGISIIDQATNTVKPYDLDLAEINDKLKCGFIDSKNRFWIGSQKGLFRSKNGTGKITKEEKLGSSSIRVITEDSQNRLWVGSFFGITVFDDNDTFTITKKDGLSHDYIMSILEDADGSMWIGTRNGLNHYEDGKITKFNSSDGLAGEFVFRTYLDSEGVLWIVGNAGLTRYKNGVFTAVTSKDGLTSNTMFQILEDEFGKFWFTTNQKNVSTFYVLKSELNAFCDGQIASVNSVEFNRSDGLKASAATSSATSLKDEKGRLWFATQFGVEMIDPSNIEHNTIKPPVIIEFFNVNDKSYKLDSAIVIPYGKNRIDIGFASLSYRYPTKNHYKYQLEGYDDKMTMTMGKLETSYTNLSPGSYTFKVLATNNDNVWNDIGASISFTIKPAYYQRPIFFIFCILLTVAFVLLIYNLRIRSLKRARITLEKTVDLRTSELVQKKEEIEAQNEEIEAQKAQIKKQNDELKQINHNLEDIVDKRTNELKVTYQELLDVNKELDTFIYRSVHDIRGPIARLQGLSQLIKMQTQDENILNLVGMLNQTSEEMNEVFYKLINIVRMKTSDLQLEQVIIRDVVLEVIKQFETYSLNGSFETSVNIDPTLSLTSNEDIIKTILFQIIENAIKFKKESEEAFVKIEADKDKSGNVILLISDYGVGFRADQLNEIFDMFYVGNDSISSAGLGLYTVKTAAKVLKSQVKLIKNAVVDGITTFEILFTNHK